MARIQRNHGFTLLAAGTMIVGVIATGVPGLAQGLGGRVVDQAQRAVRERITNREGRHHLIVRFEEDARTDARSKADVWVVGTGTVLCSGDGRTRTFSYDAVVNTRDGNVSESHYDWRGDWYTIP
jgi:hypothetical protein